MIIKSFSLVQSEMMISGKPVENQHFNFDEKATITIDDILAIKDGEQVGFTVKGLASERNDYTVETAMLWNLIWTLF